MKLGHRSRALGLAALLAVPLAFSADIPAEAETRCEDYANLAVNYAQRQLKEKCGFSGARWDTNKKRHLDWCYSLKGNFERAGTENEARAKGLASCLKPHTSFCRDYTERAVAAARENIALNCGHSGARWSTDAWLHATWCHSQSPNYARPNGETAARADGLQRCKLAKLDAQQNAPAPPPVPVQTSVVKDVDVYKSPGGTGKPIGVLRTGAKVTLVGNSCRQDNWCNVQGAAVPSGAGWVYSGPDYRSLQF